MSDDNKQPTPEEQAASLSVLDSVNNPGEVIRSSNKEADKDDDVIVEETTDQDEDVTEEEPEQKSLEDDDNFPEDMSDDDTEEGEASESDDEDDSEGLDLEELLKDERPSKKRKGVPARKRIAELTAKRREAEERAAQAEQRNAALEARLGEVEKKLTSSQGDGTVSDKDGQEDQTPDKGDAAPKPDDFKYGELDPEYIKAVTKHAADEAVAEVKKQYEKERQEQAGQQKAAELTQKYNERVEAGKAAYDDFEELVVTRAENGEYPLTPETVLMALDSNVGEKVLYDIASNLKLAKQLADMSEMEQARAFGRLEARHTAAADPNKKPNKKRATKAPNPPAKRARGVSGRNSLDPKTASIADLEKKWNADGRV